MNSQKKLFTGLIVFTALLMIGCSTPPGKVTYDPELPPEKTTKVIFEETIKVTQYNGIDVLEAWYPKGKARKNTVTLPGGNSTIIFNLNAAITIGNTTYFIEAKDLELRFDFEAGKSYTFGVYTEKMGAQTFFLGRVKYGVAVWDNAVRHNYNVSKAIKFWEMGQT